MKKILILGLIYIFFSPICLGNQSENLQKLKDLYDDNILTEDQYNEAREKVLQKIPINNDDNTVEQFNDLKEQAIKINNTIDIEEVSGGECNPELGGEPCESEIEPYRYEYTTDSFLSTYGFKPEDLSPMLLELSKKTQATIPPCTTDFCFTTQAEYATDEIINKAALINVLYRHNPDIIETLNKDPNKKRGHDYCTQKYGCFQVMEKFTYENGETKWYVDGIFPEGEGNKVYAYDYGGGKALMTPDDWLKENKLTEEELVNMVKDYPNTYKFEGDELITVPLNVEYSYTDEITNTDQLLQSLLFWDPLILEERKEGIVRIKWINKDKIEVREFIIDTVYNEPPTENSPIVSPIRPGWKTLEGTDMLVINDEDPYWQTEEGLKERPPKIDTGIKYAPETLPGADPKIVPDLTPEQDKPPSDPNPPPKLPDPTILQPIDPGVKPQPVPDPTDSKLEITKEEKEQERIDNEILRRASQGDFSDYVKKELAGAAARLGVTAPKEEDFSQNLQMGSSGNGQIGQRGDGTTSKKTSSPTDPNPPPKIPEKGNFAPESMSNDPKIVPDLTPEQDKPPSDPNPPPKCGSPPCPE